VGKVRLREGVEIERWRLEGRTVLHRSWAGVVWRKKGSAMAYTVGCRFGPAPPPPPPPPAVVVSYLLEVRATPAPEAKMWTTVVRFENGEPVAVHTQLKVGPYPTAEALFDSKVVHSVTADGLAVTVRVWFDSILAPEGFGYILEDTVVVPPFNGQSPPAYPGLIHQQTIAP